MIAYCLNQNIDGQALLANIQKLITNKISEMKNPESLVLVIDIKQVTQNDSLIPKLEYKQLDQ
jgi:hypothetical protein